MEFLRRLLKPWLKPSRGPVRAARLRDLAAMRAPLLRCIEDCSGQRASRLRQQIEGAGSVQELWLLRLDAFQLIAQRHNQRVAAERIDSLLRVFDGWVDPRQLSRIG